MVDGFVKNELVDEMAKGVWLADPKTGKGFKTGRTHVRIVKRSRDKSQLELTLREGRNRQVRRMLARLGHKVRDLTRIKMGPLTLQGLGPGEFRPLTPREVRELREMAQSRAKRQEERKGEKRQRPRDTETPRDRE
jgi:pseudouridine synthase